MSIRFIRWTPHGVIFLRSGKIFRCKAESDRDPLRVGEWTLKEGRFALSPGGARIAVVPGGEKVWNIWEIGLPGGEGRKITDSIYKDYFPVYDPSGTAIYFISYRGGRPDIWRVGLKDLSTGKLTDDDREEEQLAISPDGKTLLYTASVDEGRVSLYSLQIRSGRVKEVASDMGDVSCLRFSPEGDRYAFCSGGGLWIGYGRKAPERICDADFVAWQSGGRGFFYCKGGDIWRHGFGIFSREQKLTRNTGVDTSPCPSIDGRSVAYSTGPGDKPELLTVVSSSFSPRSRVWCTTDVELINRFYLANGHPGEAARYFDSIIDKSRQRERIAHLLADDYLERGKYRRAIDVLRKYTGDSYAIGKIYMYYLHDFSSALRYFKRTKEAKGKLMLISSCRAGLLRMYCRGWVDIQRGNYERGLELVDRFLERSERLKALEPIYFMRSEMYDRNLNDTKKAILAYRQALEAWPDSDRALSAEVRLAELLEEDGKLDEALAVYRSIVETVESKHFSEKAKAYVGILRITLERGEDLQPLLREIGADQGPYRVEFSGEAVLLLDKRGDHEDANRILRLALFDWGVELDELEEGPFMSLSRNDIDKLVRARLDRLPLWVKDRIIILSSKIEPELAPPIRKLLKGSTPPEARKIMEDISNLYGNLDLEEDEAPPLDVIEDYILGNLCLNEGDVREAVPHFKRLCWDRFKSYCHQLPCCLEADRKEAEEWLKLERKYAFSFWGDALWLIEFISGKRDFFSPRDDRRRGSNFAGEYESFISNYPGSPLLPACAARVASTLPESEKRKALLKILSEHKSGCISIPFSLLINDYVVSGNYGLALAVGEPLARSVGDPFIKLTIADLLSDVGGEREAKAFLWDISINYTESPEWEVAQEELAFDLICSGNYESALMMIDELIEKRPSLELVLSGKAQLLRIELLAKLGRLKEAAEEAEEMIVGEAPYLHKLPAYMTDELTRFMFQEKKEALARLHSSLEPEEKARLKEMDPRLKEEK